MSRALPAILLCVYLAAPAAAGAADRAATEQAFQKWLATDLWPEAKTAGVSRATFEAAFAGVAVDFDLPELTISPPVESQAEFRSPAAYFDERTIAPLVRAGRMRLKEWVSLLAAVEKRYGIPAPVVVALWARESDFGRAALPYSAIRSLATGAFIGRRKDLFRSELIAALQILEAGDVTPERMRSSWAGALGQPQLLPSAFRKYAVDFDDDGKRDIWNSVPDSLASIAHSLSAQGWNRSRGWGFEAAVPAGVACSLEGPEQGKAMSEWAALGVKPTDGTPMPATKRTGYLLMPAGRLGPAFIVSENFYVVKTYNNSDLYALFVLHLADRFAAGRAFHSPWQKLGGFSRAEITRLQQALEREGHDVGNVDGLVGFKTRIAVGRWQAKMGTPVTCYPDKTLMDRLR